MTDLLPARSRIANAWEESCGYDVPWGEIVDWGEPRCWACHYYAESWPDDWDKANGLERCHIVPKCLGGSSEPLNLVLLCERCHEESPDHANSQHLFRWMRERPKRHMGTWLPDQYEEMARLCKLAIGRNMTHETLGATVRNFVVASGDHFGWTSDGTRQALLWHLESEIEGAP